MAAPKVSTQEEEQAIREMVAWLSELNGLFIELGEVDLQRAGTFAVVRKDNEIRSREVFSSSIALTPARVTVGAREPVIFHFTAAPKPGHPEIDFKEIQVSARQMPEHMPATYALVTRAANRLGLVTEDKTSFEAYCATIQQLVKGRKAVQTQINQLMTTTATALVKATNEDAYADSETFGSF